MTGEAAWPRQGRPRRRARGEPQSRPGSGTQSASHQPRLVRVHPATADAQRVCHLLRGRQACGHSTARSLIEQLHDPSRDGLDVIVIEGHIPSPESRAMPLEPGMRSGAPAAACDRRRARSHGPGRICTAPALFFALPHPHGSATKETQTGRSTPRNLRRPLRRPHSVVDLGPERAAGTRVSGQDAHAARLSVLTLGPQAAPFEEEPTSIQALLGFSDGAVNAGALLGARRQAGRRLAFGQGDAALLLPVVREEPGQYRSPRPPRKEVTP